MEEHLKQFAAGVGLAVKRLGYSMNDRLSWYTKLDHRVRGTMIINGIQDGICKGPAYEAYCKAADAGKRLPELEGIILTSPFYAYAYAMDVIKDRWIEAEDIIMLDPLVVCLYAIRLIKGKVSEKMHNMMILHGIENPENGHVISYFEFIEKPYSPDASIHLSLDP